MEKEINVRTGQEYSLKISIPELEDIIKRISELEESMDSLKASKENEYRDEYNRLKRELEKAMELLEDEKRTVRNLREQNQELEIEKKNINFRLEKTIAEAKNLYKEMKELENCKNEKIKILEDEIKDFEGRLEEFKKISEELKRKLGEVTFDKNRIDEKNKEIEIENQGLKKEIIEIENFLKAYDEIYDMFTGMSQLNDIREYLNIPKEKNLKNKIQTMIILDDVEKLGRNIQQFYKEQKKYLESIDREFVKEVNKYSKNKLDREILYIPTIGEDYNRDKMYDLDNPDKLYKIIDEVYSPGVMNLEGKFLVRAVVKGRND